MPLAQQLLAEFEEQAPITHKFLERLPEDRLTWKPHEKSRSAGQLALHIARVPGDVIRLVQQNPAQAPDFSNMPQALQPARDPRCIRGERRCGQKPVATVRQRQHAGDVAYGAGR